MDVQVGAFSGPEKSLLLIDGGSATAEAWQWARREAAATHVWACAALTAAVRSGRQPAAGLGEGQESPPATFSLSGKQECGGGGAETAKNSHGLWDWLFPRNQWN